MRMLIGSVIWFSYFKKSKRVKATLLPWSWAERRLEKSHNYWITPVRPDGSGMEKDILSLKEPLCAVRPVVAFGLDEKESLNAATRWLFRR
jgi:hypothetical protein